MTFGEVEKKEIESVPKKFLEVLKLRAEQVFIKEDSGGEEWKRLLDGIGRLR